MSSTSVIVPPVWFRAGNACAGRSSDPRRSGRHEPCRRFLAKLMTEKLDRLVGRRRLTCAHGEQHLHVRTDARDAEQASLLIDETLERRHIVALVREEMDVSTPGSRSPLRVPIMKPPVGEPALRRRRRAPHAGVSAQRPIDRPARGGRGGYALHAPSWRARTPEVRTRSATRDCDWHARCNSFRG